jgi:hypothetical protein
MHLKKPKGIVIWDKGSKSQSSYLGGGPSLARLLFERQIYTYIIKLLEMVPIQYINC